jgi:hypothetical protein
MTTLNTVFYYFYFVLDKRKKNSEVIFMLKYFPFG